MRTLGIVALTVLLLIGGSIVWWVSINPTYNRHFRLAIEVEVDGVTRIGTSIIEVRTTLTKINLGEAGGPSHKISGDAVLLDLGHDRNVIATLTFGPNGRDERIDFLDLHAFQKIKPDLRVEDIPRLTGRVSLTGNLVPTLVTFADLNDPSTARVVMPAEFERVFGPRVHFKEAWVEMTSDPITRGIEQRLPWIARMKAKALGGTIDYHAGRFTVNVPYFTRG